MDKIPNPVWACLTVSFVSILGVLAWMASIDADATEIRSFLNTVVNLVTLVVSGSAAVYAGKAQNQTNNNLDKRIKDGVTAALDRQRSEDTGLAGPTRDGGVLQ